MYVCMYVYVLLIQFLTDFLETGTKLFQILRRLSTESRIFDIFPWGATRIVSLTCTLSYVSDRFLTFTKTIEEIKTDKKAIVTFLPTANRLPKNTLFLGTTPLNRNHTTASPN